MRVITLGLMVAVIVSLPTVASSSSAQPKDPAQTEQNSDKVEVIAHRGASGYRPEHTLAAYRVAIGQGASIIEPDLVSTRDGVLVARHENEISATTDVSDRSEFADRKTTKVIDGKPITGWFTEDFTLKELRTLRAKERIPDVRPRNTAFDGRYVVPTFDEVIKLARDESKRLGRTISVAPETKHPSYFKEIGLDLTPALLKSLRRVGWENQNSPVLIQSFEVENLKELNRLTKVQLVQLTEDQGAPYDVIKSGKPTTYQQMMRPNGLRKIARYAEWLSPEKNSVLPRDAAGRIDKPSPVVKDAHAAGLKVVVYTVRNENRYLPTNLRKGNDPNAHGDVRGELFALFDAGVDAVFADFPDTALAAAQEYCEENGKCS